jgi:hypothetical protein
MSEHGASINVPTWDGEPRGSLRLRKGHRLAVLHALDVAGVRRSEV